MNASRVAFLVDVDDTLIDNDRIRADIEDHLDEAYGPAERAAYWEIQERRFVDLGYRDYLGAVQEWWLSTHTDPRLLGLAEYLLEYPFAERLYPGALEVLARLRDAGTTVVLTDGDAVFQPHKVARAGIRDAADGVLVYVHKEESLEDVERRYAAGRYVLVDDKARILAAAKGHWGPRVTTVLPRTGQFANDAAVLSAYPEPDVAVDGIGDLLTVDLEELMRG